MIALRLAAVLPLLLCPLPAEVVDRIAVSVGTQVITAGQIREEIRVTAFLNHEKPDLSVESRRKAAERLVEQTLFKRDMEFSRFPLPEMAEAVKAAVELRTAYPSEDAFQADLRGHGIDEDQLTQHLWWQISTLRFIEYRFKPTIQVPEQEIRDYYEKKRTEWQAAKVSVLPTLEQSRADIEKILLQQRVDQAVDRWLGDTRTQVEIVYRKEAFLE